MSTFGVDILRLRPAGQADCRCGRGRATSPCFPTVRRTPHDPVELTSGHSPVRVPSCSRPLPAASVARGVGFSPRPRILPVRPSKAPCMEPAHGTRAWNPQSSFLRTNSVGCRSARRSSATSSRTSSSYARRSHTHPERSTDWRRMSGWSFWATPSWELSCANCCIGSFRICWKAS